MSVATNSVDVEMKRSSLKGAHRNDGDVGQPDRKSKMKRSLSFADENGTNLIKVTYSDKLHYSEGIGATAKDAA